MTTRPVSALVAEARASGDFSELVRAIPFARFLGMELVADEGDLIGKLRYAPHLVGNPMLPALHGGTLGALLESIAIFAVLAETEAPVSPKTISITVEYLRSARPVDTFARADIVRQGRRVATVRSLAWQDNPAKPVAAASVQLLLPDLGARPAALNRPAAG
jgi:uncharacterized protein (TIGR00369 family)